MNIFFSSGRNLDDTARAIGDMLGMVFRKADVQGERYQASGICCQLSLYGEHGIEDDMGMSFSKYEYQMNVDYDRRDSVSGDAAEHAENLKYFAALCAFDRICKVYPSMLAFNLQEFIAEDGPSL